VPRPAHGQELTLAEALRRAERDAYANRIAAGESDVGAAGQLAALQGVLPNVRLEAATPGRRTRSVRSAWRCGSVASVRRTSTRRG
jgi:hypothetical protein